MADVVIGDGIGKMSLTFFAKNLGAAKWRAEELAVGRRGVFSGKVVEVVYAGPVTRFVVDLDAGGRLVALQQNLQSSSVDVQSFRDAVVTLHWQRSHVVRID